MGSVRIASEADAEAIAAIYAPYVLGTAISFEETPPTPGEMARRMAATLPTHPFLVYEEAGAVLGYCYGGAHGSRAAYRWSCNVSVYVAGAAQQKGIGRTLYTALFDLLDRQGFHALFAGIALPNAGSVGLHEAMGFAHLGTYREVGFKNGAWHDVGYWRRGLRQGPPAADPIPFQALDRVTVA
ncbi:MAG: family N-acetyltransferase [Caulobacter sp.]|jgi:phosphinothricin acetyltransferase|nr:family N-acetyltransferase [Caulobacter sp.]